MRYTKEIFDILSKGGFIAQNSISQQRSHLYDAIEDDFNDYQEYFSGIGFQLEGGNGYYYFSRAENRVDLTDKVQRLAQWIDHVWISSRRSTTPLHRALRSASRTSSNSSQATSS